MECFEIFSEGDRIGNGKDTYEIRNVKRKSHLKGKADPDYEYTTWIADQAVCNGTASCFLKICRIGSSMEKKLRNESAFRVRFPYIEYVEDGFEFSWKKDPDNRYYAVVSEYIEGTDLKTFRENLSGTPDEKRICVLKAIHQLLLAMDTYSSMTEQEKCKVHRDLKPANIMVRADSNDIVIIDFDWAHVPSQDSIPERLRNGENIGGTPGYCDPRNFGNLITEADIRMDIYSAALIIYYLLTGQEYMHAYNFTEKYLKDDDLAYNLRVNRFPEDSLFPLVQYKSLFKLVAKGMSERDRYQTPRKMLDDFEICVERIYRNDGAKSRKILTDENFVRSVTDEEEDFPRYKWSRIQNNRKVEEETNSFTYLYETKTVCLGTEKVLLLCNLGDRVEAIPIQSCYQNGEKCVQSIVIYPDRKSVHTFVFKEYMINLKCY